MKSFIKILLILFPLLTLSAQQKFMVKSKHDLNSKSMLYIVDEKGKILRNLDEDYVICFTEDKLGYFSIVSGPTGWEAIDSSGKVLFNVYNTSYGEPSPDELIENRIRIVDKDQKIGFADEKGNIIIKPQFDRVSEFQNGKAIIGENCEMIPWDKDQHKHEGGCQHFSTVCKRHGFIDKKGNIKLMGDYSFEEVAKKINWKYLDF